MVVRLARVRKILAKVIESESIVNDEVVSAEVSACLGFPQSAYYNEQDAADAIGRALERSILLVDQLRVLRLAVLNGWNAPDAVKSELTEMPGLAGAFPSGTRTVFAHRELARAR
jgi:hypothetical protein